MTILNGIIQTNIAGEKGFLTMQPLKLFIAKGGVLPKAIFLPVISLLTISCLPNPDSVADNYPHTPYPPYTTLSENSSNEFLRPIKDLRSLLGSPRTPDPFVLEGETFFFDWCTPSPRRNQSFKDLNNRLTDDSAIARDMAQLFVATGERAAADKSVQYLYAWARESTLMNGYEMGMDPGKATFDGMEKGYCNRSWNMMLDSVWQTYGLMNFSIAYSIINDTPDLSSQYANELQVAEQWLTHQAVPAVNAGLHAWTRFADANPTSGAYQRYRADNHITWALAGLAAAGMALQQDQLLDYVYYGKPWDDGVSGLYSNSSALVEFLPAAIKSDGEVFDQAERAIQHKGFFYGNFSLWAMVMSAEIMERAGYAPLWEYRSENSGSIQDALIYYAPYVSGERALTDQEETTEPEFFSFISRIALPHLNLNEKNRRLLVAAATASEKPGRVSQPPGHIGLISPEPLL